MAVALLKASGQVPLQPANSLLSSFSTSILLASLTPTASVTWPSSSDAPVYVADDTSKTQLSLEEASLVGAYLGAVTDHSDDDVPLDELQTCSTKQGRQLPRLVSSVLSWLWPMESITTANPAEPASMEIEEGLDSESWSDAERQLRHIPQYVLDHAPLVHLSSEEDFWPCDIADHLKHVKPFLGLEPLKGDNVSERYNLTNLQELNSYRRGSFLTSDDNVEDRPDWLGGESNIPEESRPGKHGPGGRGDSLGRRSDAPVTVIVVDKGDGVVDAFYHYFYCYNLGLKVLNVRFGNHVGDWEHMVVRFKYGKPDEVWYSEHSFGQAFKYDAVEKIGKRPVGYSAIGTHAMYAIPGTHRYVLPWGLLHDETDRGPLWDPLLNMHAYTFNLTERRLRSSTLTPRSPTQWFYYIGHWGDKAYPIRDRRQYYFAGQYHYVSGPSGPIFKSLGRREICLGGRKCEVQKSLDEANRIRKWSDWESISGEEERLIHERYGYGEDSINFGNDDL